MCEGLWRLEDLESNVYNCSFLLLKKKGKMVIFSPVVLHCGKTYRGWNTLKALYLVVLTMDHHVPLKLLEELGFD